MIQHLISHWWRIFTFRHDGSGLDNCSKPLLFSLLLLNVATVVILFAFLGQPGVEGEKLPSLTNQIISIFALGLFMIAVGSSSLSAAFFIHTTGATIILEILRAAGVPPDFRSLFSVWMFASMGFYVYRVSRRIIKQAKSR